ncbi:30129_t:CDS:2, partial [Gigaspora margarita]
MTDIDHKKEKCIRCRGHYTKESFIGKNGETVSSCINCRTSISNTNQIKAKENNEKEIIQCQNLAYTQDQLVKVLLNFIDSYKDFDNAKPCSQVLHIDISVFLNSFIDRIETSNENEYNKLIAYQIVKLVSNSDGFVYIYHTCNRLKMGFSFVFIATIGLKEKPKKPELKIMKNDEILNLNYHDMNRVNPIPVRFFKKNYDNLFKDLPENLFLLILDKPMTNSKSNQYNISNKKISNTTKLLTKENLLSQDNVLLPIDIFSQDNTIKDNELSNIEYK